MRVHELADELGVDSKQLLKTIQEKTEYSVTSHLQDLTSQQEEKIRDLVNETEEKEKKDGREEAERNDSPSEEELTGGKRLKPTDVIQKAKDQFSDLTQLSVETIVEVSPEGDEWNVALEALEREGIPDTSDMLGIYEIHLDEEGDIQQFNRRDIRRRGDSD